MNDRNKIGIVRRTDYRNLPGTFELTVPKQQTCRAKGLSLVFVLLTTIHEN